ncbi:MAG: hypothetical protein RQ745_00990, partial [Longimicrobiales bacterium]|nr:hypothetical protein [Longimicrobiales bacterium]
DGRVMSIEFPGVAHPLTDEELESFIDWEIEGYFRVKSEYAAERVGQISRSYWLSEILQFQRERTRPQLTGLFGAGACLGLVGFDVGGGPHGEPLQMVVVPLTRPSESIVLNLEGRAPGFIRSLQPSGVFLVRVLESGARSVLRYPLPPGYCD